MGAFHAVEIFFNALSTIPQKCASVAVAAGTKHVPVSKAWIINNPSIISFNTARLLYDDIAPQHTRCIIITGVFHVSPLEVALRVNFNTLVCMYSHIQHLQKRSLHFMFHSGSNCATTTNK